RGIAPVNPPPFLFISPPFFSPHAPPRATFARPQTTTMQRTILCWLFLLVLRTAPAQTPAAPTQAHDSIIFHSVAEVWTAALRDNPTQRIYRLKSGQLTDDYRATRSSFLPQANVGITGQDNLKLNVTPVPGELINQPGKTLYLTFGKAYIYNAGLSGTENGVSGTDLLRSHF